MIKEVKIQNYKSVHDLTLELGRINVLIGANGCGKSNILEAIAIGSAAAGSKLNNEFLSSRGIRVTESKAMRSGFEKVKADESIYISININDYSLDWNIQNNNKPFSSWEETHSIKDKYNLEEIGIDDIQNKVQEQFNRVLEQYNGLMYFSNYLIYAPENSFLRNFEQESQIEPLGIRGEGLFKLLSVMSSETPEEFQELIENLELMDWFEGFEIPKDLVFTERRIRIKDRFLDEGLKYFDQRSSNEGFLYLMFYFALFISKYTPKFFAIDNIDASLNPKLCSELIKILTKLAKKHDKQVIFTTHNPAILDGLNLNDDEQRLMVVYRNIHGHTKTKRITKKETPEGSEPVRLSEQFLRGYLGGLPKNF